MLVRYTALSEIEHQASEFAERSRVGASEQIRVMMSSWGDNAGLFGVVSYATLNNINIENAVVYGGGNAGALVGSSIDTNIYNSSVVGMGYISGSGSTGGLAGYFAGGHAEIKNSSASIDVFSNGLVGGLIGHVEGQAIYIINN